MRAQQGHSDWDDLPPPTNINMRVDANQDPGKHVSVVIHELLHIIFSTMFIGFVADEVEEVMVLALEADMYDYVKRSKSRTAKWHSLIEQKLAAATAGKGSHDGDSTSTQGVAQ